MALPSVVPPTHHITFAPSSDLSSALGFMLADGQGRENAFGMSKEPLRRTGLRLVQGDLEYSDFELPYQTVQQDDWSAGRGLFDFENGRYWHGFMTNTMHADKAFLGPRVIVSSWNYRNQIVDLYNHYVRETAIPAPR